MTLPKQGIERDALLAAMRERKANDANWRDARTFSLVYPAGPEVDEILHDACNLYLHENALNPLRFPSLREMEVEVVGDTARAASCAGRRGRLHDLGRHREHRDGRVRQRASARRRSAASRSRRWWRRARRTRRSRRRRSTSGLEHRQVPLDDELRADVAAAERLVDERTALVVGSAPNYPFGTVDPIPELAALAAAAWHLDARGRAASAASCCRSGSGSASRCRPSTSACRA